MMLPLKRFRGLYKPPGAPRADPALAPRGLKRCLPFADPAFTDALGMQELSPARIGSAIKQGPTTAGSGVAFSGVTGTTNCLSYAVDAPGILSAEAWFVTGASVTSQIIFSWNQSNDGSNSSKDKQLYFNGSSQLEAYGFDGSIRVATDTTTTYKANTLYHAVFVADGTNLTLYLNGKQVAQSVCGATFTGYSLPAFLVVGAQLATGSSAAFAASGTVLLINYSSVAWTAEEVTQRYLDPLNFLAYPEDDIFAVLVGVAGGTTTITLAKASWNWVGNAPVLTQNFLAAHKAWNWNGQAPALSANMTAARKAWNWSANAPAVQQTILTIKKAWAWAANAPTLQATLGTAKRAWVWLGNPLTQFGPSGSTIKQLYIVLASLAALLAFSSTLK